MRNALSIAAAMAGVLACAGCSKDEGNSSASGSSSASAAAAATSAPPVASSAAPIASAPPAEPPHECPDGSSGVGSFAKPCDGKGTARMMTVKWTKTGDDGPSFAVTNKSKIVIVWGKIAVYFYDKAGKQLDLPPDSKGNARHYHSCSGLFFQGVMNPGENAVLTFSCVPKSVVPEGTATIEAEMETVGFADPSGKKVDFYWSNPDLAPDARKKGGK